MTVHDIHVQDSGASTDCGTGVIGEPSEIG